MPDKFLYTLVRPALFSLDPETAHNFTLPMLCRAAALGLTGAFRKPLPDPRTVMGITFPNPVGLAAGLDKDGAYIDGLAALGFDDARTAASRLAATLQGPRLSNLPDRPATPSRACSACRARAASSTAWASTTAASTPSWPTCKPRASTRNARACWA